MLCYDMICYIMLCYIILLFSALSHSMSCYVMHLDILLRYGKHFVVIDIINIIITDICTYFTAVICLTHLLMCV
jgi:hypothetical protein